MSQNVYTKDQVDMRTGEVVTREIFRKTVANTEQFVRVYIEDAGLLAKCSGAEQSVITCCYKYLDYNTNEFILTPERRKAICQCGVLKLNTVSSAISRLMKKGILLKKSGSTYILNPKIFFYGKELERAKIIKTIHIYKIEQPSNKK